jgi:hypothetical protein
MLPAQSDFQKYGVAAGRIFQIGSDRLNSLKYGAIGWVSIDSTVQPDINIFIILAGTNGSNICDIRYQCFIEEKADGKRFKIGRSTHKS